MDLGSFIDKYQQEGHLGKFHQYFDPPLLKQKLQSLAHSKSKLELLESNYPELYVFVLQQMQRPLELSRYMEKCREMREGDHK